MEQFDVGKTMPNENATLIRNAYVLGDLDEVLELVGRPSRAIGHSVRMVPDSDELVARPDPVDQFAPNSAELSWQCLCTLCE